MKVLGTTMVFLNLTVLFAGLVILVREKVKAFKARQARDPVASPTTFVAGQVARIVMPSGFLRAKSVMTHYFKRGNARVETTEGSGEDIEIFEGATEQSDTDNDDISRG